MESLVLSERYNLKGGQESILLDLDMQVLKARINARDRRISNDVLGEIEALKFIKENWDSYGAEPVAQRAIDNAYHFISQVRDIDLLDSRRPIVSPEPNGGVLLKWVSDEKEFIIWFLADQAACVCLEKVGDSRETYDVDSLPGLVEAYKRWSNGC